MLLLPRDGRCRESTISSNHHIHPRWGCVGRTIFCSRRCVLSLAPTMSDGFAMPPPRKPVAGDKKKGKKKKLALFEAPPW